MTWTWWLVVDAAVVTLLGAIAVLAGSPLVKQVFRQVDNSDRAGEASDDNGQPPPAPSVVAAARVLRGGQWIGGLERMAAFAAMLGGWKEGIAVVLAIKGLARYPELSGTTSAAAERFIIGTFVSILFAIALGCLALWLVGLSP